ncbi:hypothetical protein DVDV_0641 [Desulfovibrio sp. DV]|uniref:HI1506-related protein n=1 Tax=Desulfovibrio sp. DV TaxID=1844708 RepID=UPI00094B9F19|nr:HI1506-related protein [Desulfovibrio sp. DV]OLN30441.1 hypothetical protein DVDV_0641 [Desulfovibrio sp. DV]
MSTVNAIVRTRSLRGGHYRAGLKHEVEPGDIPPGTLTEGQLAQLQADPDLEVECLDAPQDAPPPRKKKAASPTSDAAPAAGEPAEGAGAPEIPEAGDEDFGFDDDPEAPEAKPEGK